MNGIRYASTINLGTTRTDAEFSPIKLLLINQFSSSSTYAIVADSQLRVILPFTGQDNPYLRISMTSPKTKYCPAKVVEISSGRKKPKTKEYLDDM